jgi:ATP-dependent Clp protease ATP-binding subunit ClpA
VVVLAQEEAQGLRHNYIGTEHLLLGLLREEEGVGAHVLGELGVSLDDVRAQVAEIIGRGDVVTAGQIPFTPRAKKVLELSLREALTLGHNYIGTEHVLLGIARESDGVAARILLDKGAGADAIRDAVVRKVGSVPLGDAAPRPSARLRRGGRRSRLERPATLIVLGWALFGVAAGLGLLVGWLIWG